MATDKGLHPPALGCPFSSIGTHQLRGFFFDNICMVVIWNRRAGQHVHARRVEITASTECIFDLNVAKKIESAIL